MSIVYGGKKTSACHRVDSRNVQGRLSRMNKIKKPEIVYRINDRENNFAKKVLAKKGEVLQ